MLEPKKIPMYRENTKRVGDLDTERRKGEITVNSDRYNLAGNVITEKVAYRR